MTDERLNAAMSLAVAGVPAALFSDFNLCTMLVSRTV
jgi:hypothetical protein